MNITNNSVIGKDSNMSYSSHSDCDDDEPKLLDHEPAKKKEKTIPQMVSDFISSHNN